MSEYKGKYAVTFEIEIACEMSAFILSEYRRYFKSKNLSGKDMQDPRSGSVLGIGTSQKRTLQRKNSGRCQKDRRCFQ